MQIQKKIQIHCTGAVTTSHQYSVLLNTTNPPPFSLVSPRVSKKYLHLKSNQKLLQLWIQILRRKIRRKTQIHPFIGPPIILINWSSNVSLKSAPIDRQFWGQRESEHPFSRKLKFILSQFLHNRSEQNQSYEKMGLLLTLLLTLHVSYYDLSDIDLQESDVTYMSWCSDILHWDAPSTPSHE